MKIERLEQLLQEELQDLYDAEKQIVKALPKMTKAASSEELRDALQEHLEVTKGQVQRLEQVFEMLDMKAKSKPCAGMRGVLQEGQEVLGEDATDELMDVAIIGAAQRVEHYEMAAYGTARTFAQCLENEEAAELLQETLTEEEEADQKLTQISESLLETISGGESEEMEETPRRSSTRGKSSGKARRGAGR